MDNYSKRAMIAASGQVLTESLPENYDDENWSSDDYEDIDDWVINHVWEPYEQWNISQLWAQIDSVACTIKSFHESEMKYGSCGVAVDVLDIQK